jgi:hypothetical protein
MGKLLSFDRINIGFAALTMNKAMPIARKCLSTFFAVCARLLSNTHFSGRTW